MNNFWLVPDDDSGNHNILLTAQTGGHENRGLCLFKMDYSGKCDYLLEISDDFRMIGDGFPDEHNNLYIVYSAMLYNHHANVYFLKLDYDSVSKTWSISKRVILFRSDFESYANRATLAKDSAGNLWCAFRKYSTEKGTWSVKVYVSRDDGDSWLDDYAEFGLINGYSEKNPRIVAKNDRVGLVFSDVDDRRFKYKFWSRLDTGHAGDEWTSLETIVRLRSKMEYSGRQYWLSHWSLAADDTDNLHLAYEDRSGVYYVMYDGKKWLKPVELDRRGAYPSVSVSSGGEVFVVYKSADNIKIQACGSPGKDFATIVLQDAPAGKKRTVVPCNIDRFLPILYETDHMPFKPDEPRYELFYSLMEFGSPHC